LKPKKNENTMNSQNTKKIIKFAGNIETKMKIDNLIRISKIRKTSPQTKQFKPKQKELWFQNILI